MGTTFTEHLKTGLHCAKRRIPTPLNEYQIYLEQQPDNDPSRYQWLQSHFCQINAQLSSTQAVPHILYAGRHTRAEAVGGIQLQSSTDKNTSQSQA